MLHRSLIVLFVLLNLGLAARGVMRPFPTADEARLVPSGLDHWRTGSFRAASDIPPLARMVAALPVIAQPAIGSTSFWREGTTRSDANAATKYFVSSWEYRLARIPGLLWWAAGAWLIVRWAGELHGRRAGWLALALWAAGPNILAREPLASPDLPAAVICLAATYSFWQWWRRPSWGRAAAAGALLGVALLTEFAALALLIAWPIIAIIDRLVRPVREGEGQPEPVSEDGSDGASPSRVVSPSPDRVDGAVRIGQVVLGLLLGAWVLNAGYGFAETGLALDDFRFTSSALSGARLPEGPDDEIDPGNRFAGTWLGYAIVPVPADYLRGLDIRWRDAERRSLNADEIAARTVDRGAFSMAILLAKVPLTTGALILVAVVSLLIRPPARGLLADELAVWIPPAVFVALALSPAGFLFPIPVMLILPAPFAIVATSRLALFVGPGRWKTGGPVLVLLLGSMASGLAASSQPWLYLNQAAARMPGFAAMARRALPADGGQDLFALRDWLDEHPNVSLAGLACRAPFDPRDYGIRTARPSPLTGDVPDEEYSPRGGPHPGYFAFDTDHARLAKYAYVSDLRPVARFGESLLLFHLTPQDVDRVRKQAGMATDGDLAALKRWLTKHTEARPLGLACHTVTDPRALGIADSIPPIDPGDERANASWYTPRTGPFPGTYALDRYSLTRKEYGYFREFQPVERVGDGLQVYRVSSEDAERVRRRMGRPPLPSPVARRESTGKRGFLERDYRDADGTLFHYTVFVPADYAGDRPYPLILFLHGAGEAGNSGKKYLSVTFPPAVDRRKDIFGFIAVIPQGHSGGWAPAGEDARAALAILAKVESEYNVDPDRVSLIGVSSGAAGVWELAAADPDRWAAIVPVAGGGDATKAPRIARLPCWCLHNTYDLGTPARASRRMVAALRQAGGHPRYTEFVELSSDFWQGDAKAAHNAWDKAYRMPELYEWLIQQKRHRQDGEGGRLR